MKILNYGDESLDRLSELPDSLIHDIIRLLPMSEVVRTSLLSKRWKNLWTTTTCLNFEDFKMGSDAERIRKFITWVLMSWRGIKIFKFKIDFGNHLTMPLCSDTDLWVGFAKKYGVEELHVDLGFQVYWAPQCLYSCSSLRTLHLRGCNLLIPTNNVNWNQLTYLSIDYCGHNEDLIHQILSGSPKLEYLVLVLSSFENLTIQSTSLRYLYICKYAYNNGISMYKQLRISTPNLEMLELLNDPYSKCLVNNVPSLTRVNLYFCSTYYGDHYFLCYGYSFVEETLRHILPTVQHVKVLGLTDCCIKVLGHMKNKNMLSPFPNVKELELRGCFEELYEQILSLLELFPELEMLDVFQQKKTSHGRESVKFEANPPDSFLQQLRTIMITWDVGEDSIFPFIEILPKYASKLEKMVFQVRETTPSSNSFLLQLASQKVLRMPRSSPTAELIFNMI